MTKEAAFSYSKGTIFDRLLHRWRSGVVERQITRGASVCDLGCGRESLFLKGLENRISSGVGIDFKAEGFSKSQKLEFRSADLNGALPAEDASFDIVTSLAVIEHLDKPIFFMSQAYRILKKGGKIIITTPAPHAKWVLEALSFLGIINSKEVHDHKNYFSKNDLKKMAEKAGFADVSVSSFQFSFNLLLTAKK